MKIIRKTPKQLELENTRRAGRFPIYLCLGLLCRCLA
jgi:hypothetical protein